MKILIVEDDRLVADYVRLALKEDGHVVDAVHDGEEGQTTAMVNDYDVIVLDVDLPKRSGLDVLRYVRQRGKTTPVLMLTAHHEQEEIVRALDGGADDYLAKPFQIGELRARIRALGRRPGKAHDSDVMIGQLTLERSRRRVTCQGKAIPLTPKEFALAEYFMMHARTLVTRTELLERVWEMNFDPGSNVVDVQVARLRGKLRVAGTGVALNTVRGSGFILEDV